MCVCVCVCTHALVWSSCVARQNTFCLAVCHQLRASVGQRAHRKRSTAACVRVTCSCMQSVLSSSLGMSCCRCRVIDGLSYGRCRVVDGLVSLPMSSCRWTCFVTDVELSMDLFRYRCRVIDGLSCCRCQVVDGLVSLPMSSCRWTCFVTDVVELLIESLRIYLCLCTVREIDAWNTRNSGHSCRSSVCLATLYTLDRCRMCVCL